MPDVLKNSKEGPVWLEEREGEGEELVFGEGKPLEGLNSPANLAAE